MPQVQSARTVELLGGAVHQSVPFGSVMLSADGAKPMSITFLFRMISNLISSKLIADEKQLQLVARQST